MTDAVVQVVNKPVSIDLSSSDAAASRAFYARLFGWDVQVNPDPLYGGYALAKIGDREVAGIGPKQDPNAPTAWAVYIGTDNAQALSRRVEEAGGTVVATPFPVGDQGTMAVYRDPTGALISAWQAGKMGGFGSGGPNTFGWAELNARGVDQAIRFYDRVFGWTHDTTPATDDAPAYTQFQTGGEYVAGALEMSPAVPAEVPSHWLVHFAVDDVDAAFAKAKALGAREMVAPQDYPGGRFAIVADPQGASFGLLKANPGR